MMAYSQRFVISLLVNGRVQKEFNDGTVELPFGSEYTLRLRNKHKDRRAVCKLFIDGDERSKNGYVIQPNSYVDIRNDSYGQGFMLVHPESVEAQDEGKDRRNTERLNGVIEGRFYLEKEVPVKEVHHHHHHHPRPRPWPWRAPYYLDSNAVEAKGGPSGQSASATFGLSADAGSVECSAESAQHTNSSRSRKHKLMKSANLETVAGVTVDAGDKGQRFRAVDIDLEGDFVTVKLLVKGIVGTEATEVAEIVDSSQTKSGSYCPNCGAKRKPRRANFCGNCGHKYGER